MVAHGVKPVSKWWIYMYQSGSDFTEIIYVGFKILHCFVALELCMLDVYMQRGGEKGRARGREGGGGGGGC